MAFNIRIGMLELAVALRWRRFAFTFATFKNKTTKQQTEGWHAIFHWHVIEIGSCAGAFTLTEHRSKTKQTTTTTTTTTTTNGGLAFNIRIGILELAVALEFCEVCFHDMTWHDMTWHNMTWPTFQLQVLTKHSNGGFELISKDHLAHFEVVSNVRSQLLSNKTQQHESNSQQHNSHLQSVNAEVSQWIRMPILVVSANAKANAETA